MSSFIPFKENFTWKNIDVLAYKEEGSHFKNINRQTLFEGALDLNCQLRYFEISIDGHSTLERHDHLHLVMIGRGQGEVLVGSEIREVKAFDTIVIPSQTWHQFRATKSEPFGFFCIVNVERDRPHRPTEDELKEITKDNAVAQFIRI